MPLNSDWPSRFWFLNACAACGMKPYECPCRFTKTCKYCRDANLELARWADALEPLADSK